MLLLLLLFTMTSIANNVTVPTPKVFKFDFGLMRSEKK